MYLTRLRRFLEVILSLYCSLNLFKDEWYRSEPPPLEQSPLWVSWPICTCPCCKQETAGDAWVTSLIQPVCSGKLRSSTLSSEVIFSLFAWNDSTLTLLHFLSTSSTLHVWTISLYFSRCSIRSQARDPTIGSSCCRQWLAFPTHTRALFRRSNMSGTPSSLQRVFRKSPNPTFRIY